MSDKRARVLLITRNLPPVIGGMERLIGHVAAFLCTHFETTVIGPVGAMRDTRAAAYRGCPLSPAALFLATAVVRIYQAVRGFEPDVVFAGSGLVAPVARIAARRAKAPYAVYLHGLDIAASHRLYRSLFVPAIREAQLVIANSHYTAERARESGVAPARIRILPPGVSPPEDLPDHAQASATFRKRHALPEAGPILFAAGRLTPRKGLAAFIKQSLPNVLGQAPDAQLVIAGEVPRHAAQGVGDEAAAIREASAATGTTGHIHLIGPLDDAGLAEAWPAADVHLFPVRHDPADPEGFGMVALEAAAWGIPTVAFSAGGVADAVADGRSGRLVEPGDYAGFAQAILATLEDTDRFTAPSRQFAADFAWPRFEARLQALVEGLLR